MASISNWDIKGKVCIVTGANCGIGRETARQLVQLGAGRVILACRNLKTGEEAIKYIRDEVGIADDLEAERRLALRQLDLASLSSVRQFAEKINAEEKQLHVLVNNAGVYAPDQRQLTADGFELSFGTNHLGHFLLTTLLLDLLKKSAPSRVVVVASVAYTSCLPWGFHIDDPNYEKTWYQSWLAYSQSKLANILFVRELDKKLNKGDSGHSGVTVYSLHPGVIKSEFMRHHTIILKLVENSLYSFLSTVQQGAVTSIHCATKPGIEKYSGQYFSSSTVVNPFGIAKDDSMAARLWELSERLVGLKPSEK